MQRVGIDTAGENFTAGRNDGVVSASQAGDGVEQDDNIAFVLDQALGLLNDHLGDLDVAGGGLVESGGDDLALHRALHIRNLFRALVDQQHHQDHFRMISGDRISHVLQEHGLAGTRRRNDQTTLSFAEWGKEIHHAGTYVFANRLKLYALLRIKRCQVVKENFVTSFVG